MDLSVVLFIVVLFIVVLFIDITSNLRGAHYHKIVAQIEVLNEFQQVMDLHWRR